MPRLLELTALLDRPIAPPAQLVAAYPELSQLLGILIYRIFNSLASRY